ncbi:PUL domain-containing protein [Cardiosporidium cionae]|uniref:PUL domain-containing protein n=1 Tax=Cardiosporidium cionae TaxID=476202 RepID=A0ABQ7JGI1_9APIC|nr:PUL domain-containing protein [Cardiosporidium cionae]|eukprot:KAF8823093.1 PUL domain-containing protein [Cardiosporidium cionae]
MPHFAKHVDEIEKVRFYEICLKTSLERNCFSLSFGLLYAVLTQHHFTYSGYFLSFLLQPHPLYFFSFNIFSTGKSYKNMDIPSLDTPPTVYLRQELEGHTQGVRCACYLNNDSALVTAGLDGLILIWKFCLASAEKTESSQSNGSLTSQPQPNSNGSPSTQSPRNTANESEQGNSDRFMKFVLTSQVETPASMVLSLCASSTPSVFYSGGNDSVAYKLSTSGTILLEFKGHTSVISALIEKPSGELITASWDGSARIWSSETGECKYILEGHTHAVCMSLFPDGTLVTGSQDYTLRFWDLDTNTFSIKDAHKDIIRSIAPFGSQFFSVSNDCMINVWMMDGMAVTSFQGHESYIYDVKVSALHDGIFFTASEDHSVRIWDAATFTTVGSLLHAATVYEVLELPNGDIVTCCEDGAARIWTLDESLALPEQERETQRKLAEAALAGSQSAQITGIDIEGLPNVTELEVYRGQRIGQTKIFREGDKAIAFQWKGASWERIGEIIATKPSKQYFDGDQFFAKGDYDYIFDVEIGDHTLPRPLPYNDNENPLLVAEKFCSREILSKAHLSQITAFILKNSNSTFTPSMEENNPSLGSTSSATVIDKTMKDAEESEVKHFPLLSTAKFDKTNWDAVKKLLFDYNEMLEETSMGRLTGEEYVLLQNTIKKMQSATFIKENFKKVELDIVFKKLIFWLPEHSLPVMDLWRAFSLHPDICSLYKGSDNGWQYLSAILKNFSSSNDGSLAVCCLRCIANLFLFPTSKMAVIRFQDQILESIHPAISSSNKQVRSTLISIMGNFAIAYGGKQDQVGKRKLLLFLRELLCSETVANIFYRGVATVGTLCVQDPSCIEICKELQFFSSCFSKVDLIVLADERVKQAIAQIVKMIGQT